MSENASIARPYAQAVFELARDGMDYARWSDALHTLAKLASEPQISVLFTHPRVAREEVATILIEGCGEVLDDAGRNLVRLLARNRRLDALVAIAERYELLRADAERTVQAKLESALPVSEDHQRRISQALEKRLGHRSELHLYSL